MGLTAARGEDSQGDDEDEPLVGKLGHRDGGKLTDGAAVTILYTEEDKHDAALKERLEDLGAEVTVRQVRADSPSELVIEAKRLVRAAKGKSDDDTESSQDE